jgi:hypothetical protein
MGRLCIFFAALLIIYCFGPLKWGKWSVRPLEVFASGMGPP